jgi:tetratricopeptide (TPR) repeat protein
MPKRHFNWKLTIVLLIGFIVLSVTAYGLRQWQRSHRAEKGLSLGNKAYSEQRWEDAAKNLGRYLAVVQNDTAVLSKYAQAQLNIRPLGRNNLQQAIGAYRAILRIDEPNSQAALKLIEIYLQIGLSGEAELIAARAVEKNPSPELRRMQAVALIEQRKFEDALKELKDIIKKYPDCILAYDMLGRLVESRPDDFLETTFLSWFDEAVKNNPSSANAYIIRGSYYLRNKEKDKALSDLTEAEKLDLSDFTVRLHLAEEFVNANILDKAEKHLSVAQTSEPANQTLWYIWANLALRSNSKQTMTRVAQTGLEALSAQPWDFMPIAAELYVRGGEFDLASNCIARLRQKEIAPTTTEFLEGLIADRKGQYYQAVKHLYQAIQMGGKSAGIRLELADVLSRLGDNQSAIQQLRLLISEQPGLASAHLSLARLLTESGSWDEASEQARIITQVLPDNFDAALIYVRARIQVLADNQTDKDSPLWQEVEEHLTKLEKSSDNVLPIKLLQFQVAVLRSMFSVAQQLLANMKDHYPSYVEVAMAEISLLTAQNKTDEAMLKLSQTISEFPESVTAVSYFATLLADRDEHQKCEKIIKDSLERIKQPVAKRQLGVLLASFYNRWNEQEKRYQLLDSLVRDIPDDVVLYCELLRCRNVIENAGYAQELINKIKTIEGENSWRWRYEQARIWFVQDTRDNLKNQYPQIVSLLKENLLANPEDQTSRVLLAAVYEYAGELQLAISTYLEALDRSPRDIHIIVSAVAVLYKANEYDRADKILRQATGEKLFHPELERLQLLSYLRRGELSSASNVIENLLDNDPNNKSIGLALALLKIQQSRFADANTLLDKLKTQEPNSLPIAAAQVELNIRQNKSAEALLICDKMVDKLHNVSAYILRSRVNAVLGRVDKAIQDLDYAVSLEPNSIEALVTRSDIYSSAGKSDKAIIDIQRAMSLSVDNIQIEKRAISLFLASGDTMKVRQGRDILDRVLASNPRDVDLHFYKARFLLAEGTAPAIAQAQKILQKITEENPKIAEAWTSLAEIVIRLKQPTKAMDIILRGLVHQPNNKSLLLLKAMLEAKSSPLLAVPTLKALLERDPNDVDVVVRLSETYLAAGESQKAVALLKEWLTSSGRASDERKINTVLAVALYKNGDKAQAQEKLNSLSKSLPDDPGPLLTQVRLFTDDHLWEQLTQEVAEWYRNHPKDTNTILIITRNLAANENDEAKKAAESILQTILKNDSKCTEAASALATLLQVTGRSEEAVGLYQQVLQLQSDNLVAINNLAWILCEDQKKYEQALALAQRGLEKAPYDYVDLMDTRGMIYYRLGQYDKAVEDFTRCLKLYPEGTPALVTSHLHLAKALVGLGQKDKSIEVLRQTLKLNNDFGGLSPADLTEAEHLLKELSGGI